MAFWLILDGEKAGPFSEEQIRARISAGEVDGDQPAWEEGLAVWKPLGEFSRFRGAFPDPGATPLPQPEASVQETTAAIRPPVVPGNAVPWRRFCARCFDSHLYSALWWIGFWAAGQDLMALMHQPWALVLFLLPWMLLEAAAIHAFGATPGKAILGVGVFNADGSRLTVRQSLKRTLYVFVAGMGLFVGLLMPICMLISYFLVRRTGAALWDHVGGFRMRTAPLAPWRILAAIAGFLFVGTLTSFVMPDARAVLMREFPELKQLLEEKTPPPKA